jgi:hypothetical protein
MCYLTIAIDYHLRQNPKHLSVSTIPLAQSVIQHRFLSIDYAVELGGESNFTLAVYEPCRIAALIYSIAVVFPMGFPRNAIQSLVQRVKMSIVFPKAGGWDTILSDLFL